MFPSYRNQSVDLLDLQSKSTDWFLYDGDIGRWTINPYQRSVACHIEASYSGQVTCSYAELKELEILMHNFLCSFLRRLVELCTTKNVHLLKLILEIVSDVFRRFGRPVYRFERPNYGVQKAFFKLFSVYFNKKYVEVVIRHFKMCLIISEWFRRPKCRQ